MKRVFSTWCINQLLPVVMMGAIMLLCITMFLYGAAAQGSGPAAPAGVVTLSNDDSELTSSNYPPVYRRMSDVNASWATSAVSFLLDSK